MICEVKTYQFQCDTMRYTDETRTLSELCDGTAEFAGTTDNNAIHQARSAGWLVVIDPLYGPELTCPFAVHGLPDGSIWPKSHGSKGDVSAG